MALQIFVILLIFMRNVFSKKMLKSLSTRLHYHPVNFSVSLVQKLFDQGYDIQVHRRFMISKRGHVEDISN